MTLVCLAHYSFDIYYDIEQLEDVCLEMKSFVILSFYQAFIYVSVYVNACPCSYFQTAAAVLCMPLCYCKSFFLHAENMFWWFQGEHQIEVIALWLKKMLRLYTEPFPQQNRLSSSITLIIPVRQKIPNTLAPVYAGRSEVKALLKNYQVKEIVFVFGFVFLFQNFLSCHST